MYLRVHLSDTPQSLGCLLHAICFFKSPYDAVFERGDSVALAVQSTGLRWHIHMLVRLFGKNDSCLFLLFFRFPPDSPYTTDVHNLISWMLTPEPAVRPHLQQIMDRLKDMIETANATGIPNGSAEVADS